MDEIIFIPGEIVWLRSGSPKMTVISHTGNSVRVVYMPFGTKEIITADIPAIALKRPNNERN